jgi:hypothetical protein
MKVGSTFRCRVGFFLLTFVLGLLRVRVFVVPGRIVTAVHPASSAVGHVDVVRMEPLPPPVMMIVAPVGVGRRG